MKTLTVKHLDILRSMNGHCGDKQTSSLQSSYTGDLISSEIQKFSCISVNGEYKLNNISHAINAKGATLLGNKRIKGSIALMADAL